MNRWRWFPDSHPASTWFPHPHPSHTHTTPHTWVGTPPGRAQWAHTISCLLQGGCFTLLGVFTHLHTRKTWGILGGFPLHAHNTHILLPWVLEGLSPLGRTPGSSDRQTDRRAHTLPGTHTASVGGGVSHMHGFSWGRCFSPEHRCGATPTPHHTWAEQVYWT